MSVNTLFSRVFAGFDPDAYLAKKKVDNPVLLGGGRAPSRLNIAMVQMCFEIGRGKVIAFAHPDQTIVCMSPEKFNKIMRNQK